MDKSPIPALGFDVLKTRNTKSKKIVKKPQDVPSFVGLTNPFYKREKEIDNQTKGNTREKLNLTQNDKEAARILKVLKVEKPKAFSTLGGDKKKVPPIKIIKGANQYQVSSRTNNPETQTPANTTAPAKTPVDLTQAFRIPSVEKTKAFKTPSVEKTKAFKTLSVEKTKGFKSPRRKICSLENCNYCRAEKCGKCPNCVDKSRHNKCMNQMCPRLNRKCQPSRIPSHDLSLVGLNIPGFSTLTLPSSNSKSIDRQVTGQKSDSLDMLDSEVISDKIKKQQCIAVLEGELETSGEAKEVIEYSFNMAGGVGTLMGERNLTEQQLVRAVGDIVGPKSLSKDFES